MISYIKDHWHGRQSLSWSLFVNFIALRVLIFLVQELLTPAEGQDYHDERLWVFAAIFVFHGVIFVWQAVGVLRAAEAFIKARGATAGLWATQLLAAIGLFLVLSYSFGAWQMTLPAPDPLQQLAELDAERRAKYTLKLDASTATLTLAGTLELGITKAFKTIIEANSDIQRVVLFSTGGNIYEARGLSQVIRRNGLATHVPKECSSACTTVFVGGVHRSVADNGRLGFHQYRIDADYAVLAADPAREQERDHQLFRQAGVAQWFIDRMFRRSADQMWYPDRSELLDAGVINTR